MKKNIRKNNDIIIYLIIILIGILITLVYTYQVKKTYNQLSEIAYKEAEIEIKTTVNNLILSIDAIRSYHLNYKDYDNLSLDEKDEIDKEVKAIAEEIIRNQKIFDNQYFWVNEVLNFEGGDNYAIRRVHQNLVETEGTFLSTDMKDFLGDTPYQSELDGINKDGEILQSYYFKNLEDDRILKKLSYAKLYEPYNWIVASGRPYEDIYSQANALYEKSRTMLSIIYMVDFCFTFVMCLAFYFYKKKRQYKQNQDEAIKLNEYRSEFIASVTHDLRTPLNAIVGLIDLINKETYSKEEEKDILIKMDMSSKYLLSLIDDILDTTAIEESRMLINDELFDIKDVIYPITSIYFINSIEHGIIFNCHCENIPKELLYGDIYRIKQVITNLLSNSLKFTNSKGHIDLYFREEIQNDNEVMLIINVIDTGCGIEKEKLDTIFNKFEQGSTNTKDIYGGSGLGLSIVKNLVNLMGGEILVKSEVDKGSDFEIHLKLKSYNKEEKLLKKAHKENILFVEIEPNQNNIKSICKNMDIDCSFASSISKALQIIENSREDNIAFSYIIISSNSYYFIHKKEIEKFSHIINKEKTQIIIASYANNYFDESAYKVIQKPILKSTLNDLLNYKLLDVKKDFHDENNDIKNLQVLLVEDNEINMFVAEKMLKTKNVTVECAKDGYEAYTLFEEKGDNYFDVIFMDCRMPILNGLEATKLIRESDLSYSKNIMIYAMTANTSKKEIEECYRVGMNGYISKPIDINIVYNVLKEVSDKKYQKDKKRL
ncbi:MAG: ATP-binding protein [Pleomorphochaeta sp.]